MFLPAIARINRQIKTDRRAVTPAKMGDSFGPQDIELRHCLREGTVIKRCKPCCSEIGPRARGKHAPGGKDARMRRDYCAACLHLTPQTWAERGAHAPADHKGRIARIMAALHGDQLKRVDHIGDRHV